MNFVIFDTETTGTYGKDEVIQFTAIVTDENAKAKSIYNFYCDTPKKSHPSALAVHGITPAILKHFSEGKTFEDYYYNTPELFGLEDVTWVGYNVNFDMRLINQTLRNNGLREHNFGSKVTSPDAVKGIHYYDLMTPLSKKFFNLSKVQLGTAASLTGLGEKQLLDAFTERVAPKLKLHSMGAHNSAYDTFVTWMLFAKYRQQLIQ